MPRNRSIPIFWHPVTLEHSAPSGAFKFPPTELLAVDEPHPETPDRIRNIKHIASRALSERTTLHRARKAAREELTAVHDPEYVDEIRTFCESGGGRIEDTTTGANERTFEAARFASGAAIEAAEGSIDVDDEIPYALVRPPGHHAQSDRADGFCFFNNVAVAAEYLLSDVDGIDSIAVVDWDVHHGNGTQEIFYDRDDLLLLSIHHDHGSWHPTRHPQTGSLEEVGVNEGEGYTVNVPIPPATGNNGYDHVCETVVEPILQAYQPDAMLVSAGQDGGIADPNGRNMLDRSGFRSLAGTVRTYADRYANGNLAVIQEGGYQASHTAFATLGVLEGLVGTQVDLSSYGFDVDDPFAWLEESTDPLREWTEEARTFHGEYWPV